MQKEISNNYIISDDKNLLQPEVIFETLTQSYWAKNIPLDVVKKSLEGSYCVGLYYQNNQVGFARLVTDYATFAYLADVFVLKEHQGKGLSKQLLNFILTQEWVKGLRNIMLATHDAHELYKPFGFTTLVHPKRYMYKFNLNIYNEKS